jgi:hypothetical protein
MAGAEVTISISHRVLLRNIHCRFPFPRDTKMDANGYEFILPEPMFRGKTVDNVTRYGKKL